MKCLFTWTERRLLRLFRKLSTRQNLHLKPKCSAFIRNTSFTDNWKGRFKNWVFVSSVRILVPSGYWATYCTYFWNDGFQNTCRRFISIRRQKKVRLRRNLGNWNRALVFDKNILHVVLAWPIKGSHAVVCQADVRTSTSTFYNETSP